MKEKAQSKQLSEDAIKMFSIAQERGLKEDNIFTILEDALNLHKERSPIYGQKMVPMIVVDDVSIGFGLVIARDVKDSKLVYEHAVPVYEMLPYFTH